MTTPVNSVDSVESKPLSLAQFNEYVHLLNTFDSCYEYSDDHQVWSRGQEQAGLIYAGAKQHPLMTEAFERFYLRPHTSDKQAKAEWLTQVRNTLQ